MAALDAIPDMKVAILGGFDRSLPLEHLAKHVSDHDFDIRKALLIGAGAVRII